MQGLEPFQNAIGQIANTFIPSHSGAEAPPDMAAEPQEAEPVRSAQSQDAGRRRAGG